MKPSAEKDKQYSPRIIRPWSLDQSPCHLQKDNEAQ